MAPYLKHCCVSLLNANALHVKLLAQRNSQPKRLAVTSAGPVNAAPPGYCPKRTLLQDRQEPGTINWPVRHITIQHRASQVRGCACPASKASCSGICHQWCSLTESSQQQPYTADKAGCQISSMSCTRGPGKRVGCIEGIRFIKLTRQPAKHILWQHRKQWCQRPQPVFKASLSSSAGCLIDVTYCPKNAIR